MAFDKRDYLPDFSIPGKLKKEKVVAEQPLTFTPSVQHGPSMDYFYFVSQRLKQISKDRAVPLMENCSAGYIYSFYNSS